MMFSRSMKWPFSNDPGLQKMIFFSFFLHLGFLSIVFFLPSLPAPKLTFGPVYEVQLVSTQEVMKNTSASREFSDKIVSDHALTRPDDVFSERMRITGTQKQDYSRVERAVEQLRNQPQTKTNVPRTAMNLYYTRIWSKVISQWSLPPSLVPKQEIETIVFVRILRNGAATDISFQKRSGNPYFDESAMRAVRKAVPFPNLPAEAGSSFEVGFKFHPSDLRR